MDKVLSESELMGLKANLTISVDNINNLIFTVESLRTNLTIATQALEKANNALKRTYEYQCETGLPPVSICHEMDVTTEALNKIKGE